MYILHGWQLINSWRRVLPRPRVLIFSSLTHITLGLRGIANLWPLCIIIARSSAIAQDYQSWVISSAAPCCLIQAQHCSIDHKRLHSIHHHKQQFNLTRHCSSYRVLNIQCRTVAAIVFCLDWLSVLPAPIISLSAETRGSSFSHRLRT